MFIQLYWIIKTNYICKYTFYDKKTTPSSCNTMISALCDINLSIFHLKERYFLYAGIRPDQLKRAINIRCMLHFFYVESCIKSSKQGRVIVCFNILCKFAVNKRQNTNYSFLPVTSKVSCIRKKRSQIICL
jgi:hypothetical protein